MALPYTGVDVRLITALVTGGFLTQEQADQVKLESAQLNKPEIQVIVEKGFALEKDVYRTKAAVYNIPFLDDLTSLQVNNEILGTLDVAALKEQQAFPFEMNDTRVKVLMADPFNINAIQFWKMKYVPRQVEIFTASPVEIENYINTKFGNIITGAVEQAVTTFKKENIGITETELHAEDTADVNQSLQNAPVAKIVNSILVFGARIGASDIHIEPQEKTLRVRYRVDGVLLEKLVLPKDLQSSITARIKIMADIKIDETRLPQDGRLFVSVDNRKFDLRVSTLPAIHGEKVVMRLLERTSGIVPLEESGLRGVGYNRFVESISLTNGVVLVTGPTNSGKTRTLAGTLARLNSSKVNIISIEDPVEIRIDGVNQIQINHDIGFDFATVLRSVLRQDPNIIMVGEIRDEETARLATRAALTGHLVLSTIHTNSATSALTRLIDMGVEPFLVASTVKCLLAQRLVRTICPYCRKPIPATDEQVKEVQTVLGGVANFDIYGYLEALAKRPNEFTPEQPEYRFSPPVQAPETLPDGKKQVYLYKGEGCAQCNGTGYKGRMGIFEVAKVTDKLAVSVLKNSSSDVLEKVAEEEGMLTMVQDGYMKAIEGITTLEEVLRVAKSE